MDEFSNHRTPAEIKFRQICFDLIQEGIHPTPTSINQERDKSRKIYGIAAGFYYRFPSNILNGRECKWLREIVLTKKTCKGLCCVRAQT